MDNYQTAVEAAMLAAEIILESGGETYRAEETLLRMCQGFGFPNAEIIAFPTGFFVSFELPDGTKRAHTLRIRDRSMCLGNINDANNISRMAASGQINSEQALKMLRHVHDAPGHTPAQSALAFAFSSAFFAIMFRGGPVDFFISFLTGFTLQFLMPVYRRIHAPAPLVSLFSGIIGAAMSLVLIKIFGGNQEAIIAGALMPLLPGLAMTNAVRDTMRGDLVSGLARGADALLSVIVLGCGVAVVLML